jgi:hypothetical protein
MNGKALLMRSHTTKSTTKFDAAKVLPMAGKVFIAAMGVVMFWSSGQTLAQQAKHDATGFECGFIYDKFKGGKSGDATCSYEGEKVFGLGGIRAPANEHCKTEPVANYVDLVNVHIDLSNNKVTWEEQRGSASFFEPGVIEYIMRKEKLSKAEATKMVTEPLITPFDFTIYHTERIYDGISVDEVTRKRLNSPRYVPAYLITFGKIGRSYSLYVPGKDTAAILSEYVTADVGGGGELSSWINLRFGKCRKQVK